MKTYREFRYEWTELRKVKKSDKTDKQIREQSVFEMVIDKTLKYAKEDQSSYFNNYLQKAIKSEYKQFLDADSQGVDCKIELTLLKSLLPQKLSAEETTGTIIAIMARYETPTMQDIMKDLKKIDGIDMKFASQFVKQNL